MKQLANDPPLWLIFLIYAPVAMISFQGLLLFVCGLAIWSLAEYSMHRWIFHSHIFKGSISARHRAYHRLHHMNPSRFISIPLIYPALATAVIALIIPAALSGYATGYLAYEVAHRMNLPWHKKHHEQTGSSFGVTTPVWDKVLG